MAFIGGNPTTPVAEPLRGKSPDATPVTTTVPVALPDKGKVPDATPFIGGKPLAAILGTLTLNIISH
jgi:hypothetical protein